MKILLVSSSDKLGGAGIANFRLYEGLKNANVDVKMMVQYKNTPDPNIIPITTNSEKLRYLVRSKSESYSLKKLKPNRLFTQQNIPFSDFLQRISKIDHDLIHLNWAHKSFFSLRDILKIQKPLVITMHDMWWMTGGCHYTMECDKFQNNCAPCPALEMRKFAAEKLQEIKVKIASKPNIHFHGISHWMKKMALKSTVLGKKEIHVIPNLFTKIDFRPICSDVAKSYFNLPTDKTIVLIGSLGGNNDRRKGIEEFISAFLAKGLPDHLLISIGNMNISHAEKHSDNFYSFPNFQDSLSLSLLYSMADVTVLPSIQEAFGQMALESIACGTPVMAYKDTGYVDILQQGFTGELFQKGYLSDILNYISNNDMKEYKRSNTMNCVNRSIDFTEEKVIPKYLKMYTSLMNRN